MNLILQKLNAKFMVALGIERSFGSIVPFGIRDALSIERILNHAHHQKHQRHDDQRDGAHGEQNECQNGKASLARPMGVSKCFVAKRLNALAHRFECGHHYGQCTPMRRYARKCADSAQ